MTKRVYKYGTGQPIPDGAVYLCTQVETESLTRDSEATGHRRTETVNRFVWHYFLVETDE